MNYKIKIINLQTQITDLQNKITAIDSIVDNEE